MVRNRGRRLTPLLLAGTVVAAAIIATSYYVVGASGTDRMDDAVTAKVAAKKTVQDGRQIGPSGLQIPRFVSLKRSKVNVRLGPSSDHKIAWVFHYKGLPVEIIAEFEQWRRIRDSDGQEGWVYHSLLSGKRTITVAPWRKGEAVALRSSPRETAKVVARVKTGAVGDVSKCTGSWCEVELQGYQGWIKQTMLWGVYPDEAVKN